MKLLRLKSALSSKIHFFETLTTSPARNCRLPLVMPSSLGSRHLAHVVRAEQMGHACEKSTSFAKTRHSTHTQASTNSSISPERAAAEYAISIRTERRRSHCQDGRTSVKGLSDLFCAKLERSLCDRSQRLHRFHRFLEEAWLRRRPGDTRCQICRDAGKRKGSEMVARRLFRTMNLELRGDWSSISIVLIYLNGEKVWSKQRCAGQKPSSFSSRNDQRTSGNDGATSS